MIDRYGTSVFLDPPFEVIWARLERSPTERPLLGDEATTRELWERRRVDYQRAAITVAVPHDGDPSAVAELIINALSESPCAT